MGDWVDKLRWGSEPFPQPRKGPRYQRDLRTVEGVGLRARVPSGAQTPSKQASKREREREPAWVRGAILLPLTLAKERKSETEGFGV